MDKHEATAFLFNISKEIKRSFESPIILLTMKDYADDVYRSLLTLRTTLMHDATPLKLAKIINNFHLEWLEAVNYIENFRKRIKETPRVAILNAIEFTIKCMSHRCTYFNSLVQQQRAAMAAQDRLIMQAELEIMNDMRDTVIAILEEKKHCFKVHVDQTEYMVKLNYEVDELLNWLDRIYDNLTIQFSKVIHLHVPQIQNQLTGALKEVIDEVAGSPVPEESDMLEKRKSKVLRTMVRFDASHDIEVSKVVAKIRVLEDRINKLKHNKSSAVLALQHKVIYLEERLTSLENLKTSLQALKIESNIELEDETDILDSTELQIFNHNLPQEYRCRLVEKLTKLWDDALYADETGKSIISILSAVDMKEVYTDDIGEFTVDKYGRKIYSQDGGEYQLNERNELVEVQDDDMHVYYYDDCGRYFIDQSGKRIYKAHSTASEYELYPTGQLFKLKETRDGIEYRYDDGGRYYINEDGKRIYIDPNTNEQYELDGFGNLVRVHSGISTFEPCAQEPMVVEECKYLQKTVGSALKSCLANVILYQPSDPIAFLADNLVKYRQNIEDKQKRSDEEAQMLAEQQYYKTDDNIPHHSKDYSISQGEEADLSKFDYSLDTYQTLDSIQSSTPEKD